ncbi:unnamed protein product [Microthlaspi erraticum]|uniref:Ubiquitin-like protease family profile domain-containing protein n=1 Tax=Microthlaspi erraticum TaxID=1685480 RepID=A0A6D2KKD2_9BRAS|nr:unnamed protein product [Microthlaspi erraticum]
MEEEGLPSRMFETGFEPTGRKRVNSYFTLRWVESIKPALEKEYLEKLENSQFRLLMGMGKHTFSVCFVHYLLSRQLVTNKRFELWWLYAGKPIRYGVNEFALVTGLNCDEPPLQETSKKRKRGADKDAKRTQKPVKGTGKMWAELFGDFKKPTAAWVLDKLLLGRKYKDSLTRFRLALLLLVEGILCPTSGTMYLNPKVVEMVSDVEAFLQYPWGRKSFLLTVDSAKTRKAEHLVHESVAVQGFAHAIVLVTAACCPDLVRASSKDEFLVRSGATVEELVGDVVSQWSSVNMVTAKNLDQQGQAAIRSILSSGCDDGLDEITFEDEQYDEEVEHLLSLINEDFPFEVNSWSGGVKASEAEAKETSISDCGEGDEGEDDDMPLDSARKQRRNNTPVADPISPDGCGNIENIISRVAEAVEHRSNTVFSNYVNTLKRYIDKVVENLKTDMERMLHAGVHPHETLQQTSNVDVSDMTPTSVRSEGESQKGKNFQTKARSGRVSGRKPTSMSPSIGRVLRPLHVRTKVSSGGNADKEVEANIPKKRHTRSSPAQSNSHPPVVANTSGCGIGKPLSEVSERIGETDGGSAAKGGGTVSASTLTEDDLPLSSLFKNGERSQRKSSLLLVHLRKPQREVSSATGQEKAIPAAAVSVSYRDVAEFEVSGGFKPFKQPPEEKVTAFRNTLTETWKLDLGNGLELDSAMVASIFEPTVVLEQKTVVGVVEWIQKRNDVSALRSVVYLPPQFMESLKAEFMDFKMAKEKNSYAFRPSSSLPQPNRPPLSHELESIYCPFKVNGHHWVGIIVDIKRCNFTIAYGTACGEAEPGLRDNIRDAPPTRCRQLCN